MAAVAATDAATDASVACLSAAAEVSAGCCTNGKKQDGTAEFKVAAAGNPVIVKGTRL